MFHSTTERRRKGQMSAKQQISTKASKSKLNLAAANWLWLTHTHFVVFLLLLKLAIEFVRLVVRLMRRSAAYLACKFVTVKSIYLRLQLCVCVWYNYIYKVNKAKTAVLSGVGRKFVTVSVLWMGGYTINCKGLCKFTYTYKLSHTHMYVYAFVQQ